MLIEGRSEGARTMLAVVGGACAFATFITRYLMEGTGVYLEPTQLGAVGQLVTFLGALLLVRLVDPQRLRKALAVALPAAFAAIALLDGWTAVLFPLDAFPRPVFIALHALGSLRFIAVLILWSALFSLMDYHKIVHVLIPSMLLAMLICLVAFGLSAYVGYALYCIAPLFAVMAFFAITREGFQIEASAQPDAAEAQRAVEGRRRTLGLFYLGRMAWGAGFGVVFSIAAYLVDDGVLVGAVPLAMAILCLVLAASWINREGDHTTVWTLSLFPVLAVGVLALFGDQIDRISGFALVTVPMDIVWNYQTLVQLPTYRRLSSVDAARFALIGCASLYVPFALVRLASPLFDQQLLGLIGGVWSPRGLVVAAALLVSAITMVHVARYYPATVRVTHDAVSEQLRDRTRGLSVFADDHGLTPREADVLTLIAEGYSRPYIEKALSISQGTAKTHIRHIYQKVGVTSRDELLALLHGL